MLARDEHEPPALAHQLAIDLLLCRMRLLDEDGVRAAGEAAEPFQLALPNPFVIVEKRSGIPLRQSQPLRRRAAGSEDHHTL